MNVQAPTQFAPDRTVKPVKTQKELYVMFPAFPLQVRGFLCTYAMNWKMLINNEYRKQPSIIINILKFCSAFWMKYRSDNRDNIIDIK